LWAIAVAQPLFDLLGANPEFFIAHRAGTADVVLLTLALAVLLPSVLVLAVWLVGLAGPPARTAALGVRAARSPAPASRSASPRRRPGAPRIAAGSGSRSPASS
jgi:hypothetical protein